MTLRIDQNVEASVLGRLATGAEIQVATLAPSAVMFGPGVPKLSKKTALWHEQENKKTALRQWEHLVL